MERLEAYVSGRVQMVMYRDFVQRKASGLKLVGQVRNLSDGRVHVIAEGSRERLQELVRKLHKGSLLSDVEHVEHTYGPATESFTRFIISYE